MNVFTLFGSIGLDSTGVTRGLKEAETQAGRTGAAIERDLGARLERLQTRLNSVGAGMSLLSAPLVAFGVTAVRTAGDFESAMNRVQGLTRATGDSFERLEGLAKELGATTAFSASQAADAMGNLATAGFTVEEIYDALPGVLELAAASGLDLAEASDIAAKALRGFGLEATEVTRVNDVMARASSLSNTNVRQLGEAFTYVAPIANGLGFAFEETSAAIGLISDAGIQASSAGTGLRAVLTQLITEADDLGISTRDAAGNVLPLADILAQLEERGYTAEEAMLQFGETGGPALTALLARGTDALRNLNTELETSAGTAAELAEVQMQGFNGAIANLSSAFEALQIAVAESGLIDFVTDVVKSLTGFITTASELDPAILRIAVVIGAVVASIGPALLAVGKMVEAFMAARLIIQGVTTAVTALRTAALLMAGPAGWITLGVTALVGLGIAFVATRDDAKAFTDHLGRSEAEVQAFNERLDEASESSRLFQDRVEGIVAPLRDQAENIRNSTGSVADLRAAVDQAANLMEGDAKTAFVEYAESAIAAGGSLDDIASKIAGQAERNSLLTLVNDLASGMDEEGRTAFVNYGLQAIATSETTQSAFEAIITGWTQVTNASAISAMQVERDAASATLATAQLALDAATTELGRQQPAIDRMLALYRSNLEEALKSGNEILIDNARRDLESYESQVSVFQDAVDEAAAQVGSLTDEVKRIDGALGNLRGSNITFNRTLTGETVPALRSAGTAATGAAGGVRKLSEEIEYGLDTIRGLRDRIKDLNEELETTSDEGRRIEIQLEINQLDEQVQAMLARVQAAIDGEVAGTPVSITPTLTIDYAELDRIRAEQAAEEERIRLMRERNINGYLQFLERQEQAERAAAIAGLADLQTRQAEEERVRLMRERNINAYLGFLERQELAERAAAIAGMNATNERIAAEQAAADERIRLANAISERTELAERAAATAVVNAATDRIVAQRALTAATEEAARANLGYQDGLIGTAEDATDFAASQVALADAMRELGEATDEDVVRALLVLEAALEQQREGVDKYSDAYAELTQRLAVVRSRLNDYAAASEDASRRDAQASTEAARATADLTLRKLALAQTTRGEAIASIDAYVAAMEAELAMTTTTIARAVELAEVLERIKALREGIAAGGTPEGGIGGEVTPPPESTTAFFSGISEAIRGVVASLGDTLTLFQQELYKGIASLTEFAENVIGRIPILGNALDALTIGVTKSSEGIIESISLTFNPLTFFANVLTMVLDSSEAVADMFDQVLTAIQPFIEVLGEALVRALTPFLNVAIELVKALTPIIEVAINLVSLALQPFLFILQNVILPVFTFVANIIVAIWNGIANALNAVLGVFGVNIPTVQGPGADRGTGGDGGGRAPGGGPPQHGSAVIGSSNGVEVRIDSAGNPSVSFTSSAPPAGSIARQRAVVSALQQAYDNAPEPWQRGAIGVRLQTERQKLEQMLREGEAPAAPGEEAPPPGRIEELRRERAEAVRRRDAAQSDEEIQAANEEIRRIDAEIRRLEALGAPVTPEEPPAPGLLNQLQRDRAAAVKRLQEATTEEEIRAANAEIREIDAKIARLRGLGAPTTDTGGAPRAPRRPRGGDSIFIPAPTPTAPVTPPPAPAPERPVVFDDAALNFATVSQSVQFAVATPLVEASMMMLQAARTLVGAGDPASGLFAPIPPFTAVLERLTPILDRLIVEGVDVNVGSTSSASRGISLTNALRPL